MKNFWIHQLFRFSALTDRHWISDTAVWLLGLEEQPRYRREKVWSLSLDIPWAAPGKPKLETEVSLQRVRGKRQFLPLAGKARLKGCCGGGGVGECCLLLVRRFEEVRFQQEIRHLGCEGKYKKGGAITISPVIQVLYAKWKNIMINAKRSEQCKVELKLRISYWRNDRHQS